MDARFSGKVVVVPGGAGGLGRAAAVRFAAEGARVVLVDLAAPALALSLAAVEKAGGEVLAVEADVTKLAHVERYADAAVRAFGGIDVFFNNAGVLGALKPLVDYPEDVFDRVIAVNLKGVWLGMKVVAPLLRARGGGAIVNTASIAGLRGSPNIIAYIASKHAAVGMALAASLAARGDRVIPLVRREPRPGEDAFRWDPASGAIAAAGPAIADAVVHLAGENVATGRWTAARKARILDSRVAVTRHLVETLSRASPPPRVLVCASAIGYYADRGDELLTEDSAPGRGFLAEVCRAWEAASAPAAARGIRLVNLRVGLVLSPAGGALAKMLPPFRLGLGGVIGGGAQWVG